MRPRVFLCVLSVLLLAVLQLELDNAGNEITGIRALEIFRGVRRVEFSVALLGSRLLVVSCLAIPLSLCIRYVRFGPHLLLAELAGLQARNQPRDRYQQSTSQERSVEGDEAMVVKTTELSNEQAELAPVFDSTF